MNKITRYFFEKSIAALMLTCLLLAGCNNSNNSTKEKTAEVKKVYKVGLGPWIGFGPFYLAQEKGFFKEAGVEVELTTITGIAERNSALKSGDLDGLAAPVDYFVLSSANGIPVKIVMAIDESNGGDGLVVKKEIKSLADLKGKKIGFQRGLPGEFFIRALLDEKGIKLSDLKTSDMETAQAGAAFISNSIDAAVVWEPWLSKATEKGNGYILASTKDHPNLIVDCIAFTDNILKSHPKDIKKITSALYKAIDFWKNHPDEADSIMAPHFQVDAKKYALILSGAKFCDEKRNKEYFGNSQAKGAIYGVAEKASKIWNEAGVTTKSVKAEDVISN